jgi:predicted metalloprotease with PDZ domain
MWRLLLLGLAAAFLATTSIAQPTTAKEGIAYTVRLKDPVQHLLEIQIQIPAGAPNHDLQLPVWNATYQIRDFSQYINRIRAKSPSGYTLKVTSMEKSRWEVSGTESGAEVDYEIVAGESGPFGAEFNSRHAFFNLAEILMYPVDARGSTVHVKCADVPTSWKAATALRGDLASGFTAENYDRLVDSPVELSAFQESDFEESGARYRIVVDADNDPVSLAELTSTVRRITEAETAWMNDRPFDNFLFIYHFPGASGGGMEHAYSTAITLNPQYVTEHPDVLADVTAHEFFHLWNVKRIRPQSLEPIDYTRENYTRALWFSEGVTTTAGECSLLRAGLMDEQRFLAHLSSTIADLERRPAHLTQSVEESSLDAWLEKYPYYLTPERSISYYDKGELLGVLLDLQLREVTHGRKSLRDLFQWMNDNYAKRGRFFPDSDGVRLAAETISGADFKPFFEKYVAGTEEIPWDQFFQPVGLRLAQVAMQVAEAGFSTRSNFNESPVVSSVDTNSEAARAGRAVGDVVLGVNGQPAQRDLVRKLTRMAPGTVIHFTVRGEHGERELQWALAGSEQTELKFEDVPNVSAGQMARRHAWLRGGAEAPSAGVRIH